MLNFNLLEAIAYVLPAYCANGAPVVVTRKISNLHPIDMGANFFDGRRILGDGKTLEGFVAAVLTGMAVGLAVFVALPKIYSSYSEVISLSVGAMAGDIIGAFVKRRLGLERGAPAPVLDQLGFLLFALLLSYVTHGLPRWFNLETMIGLLAVTIVLHVGTNYGAYRLGLKDKPW